jgi:hypothetical protein
MSNKQEKEKHINTGVNHDYGLDVLSDLLENPKQNKDNVLGEEAL